MSNLALNSVFGIVLRAKDTLIKLNLIFLFLYNVFRLSELVLDLILKLRLLHLL